MGEHGCEEEPGGLMPNGLLPDTATSFARALDAERWSKAEARIAELIDRIQPSRPSEERRHAVANYVQRLIMKCFPCEVFTFGSVPLKTYLPDGDIDLTAVSGNETLKDTWAIEVRDVLKNEEKNEHAAFRVKEVQYIKAEVKIIKCLVEDIVVDISFNQVGGLCTLCFLDEIDSLINQTHLFKRSIILIKAWCYYESRILGAHHGLISTYALETLVLYIFNVYNNSLAGPLEVLYRFLEFFSNFDWENFCVSLWGPVPIHSLPHMIAEPPRQDGDELLLDKAFLDICSTVYAVLPVGQENQVQPFVPKHFNVIDPLRISNNLGRSVSKGNFFRIRSAFAFGAKRLARLLVCPKENLISEVNLFFTNTWDRHGNGNRPDAPCADLWNLQPVKEFPVEESNTTRDTSVFNKKSEKNVLSGHKYGADNGLAYQGATSQVLKTVNQHFQSLYGSNIPSALYHAQNQKGFGSQIESEVSDNVERNISARGPTRARLSQNNFWTDHSNSQAGYDRFQFGRTHSSPELSFSSREVLAQGSRNKVQEIRKNPIVPTILDSARVGFDDLSPSRHHVPQRIAEAAGFNNASNSYRDVVEDLASVTEALEMHQEEQDLVNMMASSRLHNGRAQLPIHFPFPHVPYPVSPTLIASMASNQRNLTGIVPPNITMIDSSWFSSMQHPQGFISSFMPHYSPTAGPNLNSDDVTGSVNEKSDMTSVNQNDDQGFWHEDDTGSNRSEPNGGFHMLHPDDKKHQWHLNTISSSWVSNSATASIRGHHKAARESEGSLDEDDTGVFQYQTNRGNDTQYTPEDRSQDTFPVSKATSLSSKPASENSSDGSDKANKSGRDKRGRRLAASAILTALYGNSRNGQQPESLSDHSSGRDEVSPLARNHQVHGPEPAEISSSVSMVPMAPVFTNSSQQRVVENSGVVPFAFYPTGPPVPFLAMLPMINFPSDTGDSDGSGSQFVSDEKNDHDDTNPSGQSFDSAESLVQSEVHVRSNPSRNSTPTFTEHKSDILNSDFISHWQNLQYSRSCQNLRPHAPIMYPSPLMVPPVSLQGHYPWDGPSRPSANMNSFTQFMGHGPRLVPVAPLQPGPIRSSVFPRYGDEASRYRGGTGTYLPNPKVPFRERSSSNTRNHRGNYNHDRNDPDREGWNDPKARAAGRINGRIQADKPSSRIDRTSANDNRADMPSNPHRNDQLDSYQARTSSFGSRRSSHGSANVAYGVYSRSAVNSSGANPPRPAVPSAAKMPSYDEDMMYGSRAEPLKFGSRGAVLSGGNEVAESSDGNPAREGYQHRHGTNRGSSRSSPG